MTRNRAAAMRRLRESARVYKSLREEFIAKESPRALDSQMLRVRQEELALAALEAVL